MIVEVDFCIVANAAGASESVDLEDVVDVPGVIPQKFLRHVTTGSSRNIFAIFFPYPAHAADVAIKYGWKFATAEAGDVDVLARLTGNRQKLRRWRVRAGVSRENKLRHLFNALLESRDGGQEINRAAP
jgi:hypothetical protein